MTPEQERIDKVLDTLSWARTALDEGYVDGVNEPIASPEKCREIAIDRIDDAMRLLGAFADEPKFSLMVAHNGAFVSRHFDAEDEAIDAIGEAIGRKMTFPDDVVTIVIGRAGP